MWICSRTALDAIKRFDGGVPPKKGEVCATKTIEDKLRIVEVIYQPFKPDHLARWALTQAPKWQIALNFF